MKKLLAAIAGVVVLAVVVTVAVLSVSRDDAYAIEGSGMTWSSDGTAVRFADGAAYSYHNGKPVLSQGGKLTQLDAAKLLRLDDSSSQLLNSSVSVLSPTNVVDLPSKTSLVAEGLSGYQASSPASAEPTNLPLGTIIKSASGRYLVLDTGVIERGTGDAAEAVQTLSADSLLAVEADGILRIHSGDSTTELINDRLRIVLDSNGFVFDISNETLTDLATAATVDLGAIMVTFDDDPRLGSADRFSVPSATSSPDPTSSASPTATDAAASGNTTTSDGGSSAGAGMPAGNGSGSANGSAPATGADSTGQPTVPEQPSLVLPSADVSFVPKVSATATAPDTAILLGGDIVDPLGQLTSLSVSVQDNHGATIQSASLDTASPSFSWASAALSVGAVVNVEVSGVYQDTSGNSHDVIYLSRSLTIGELELASTVTRQGTHDIALTLKAPSVPASLSSLSLDVRLAEQGSSTLTTIPVDTASLIANGSVDIVAAGLDSQTSYVFSVASITFSGAAGSSSWYTVAATRAERPTVADIGVVYDAGTQTFTLTPTTFSDPDSTIDQIRYVAFTADDYAVQGVSAPIAASVVVGSETAAQPVTLRLPGSMGQGAYVFVAVVTGSDGVESFVITSEPSNIVNVTAKHVPQALFALDSAKADSLNVKYVINDEDATIVLDGSTHPVASLYAVDSTGTITGPPIRSVDLLTQADLARGVLTFPGLTKLTSYRVVLAASYDLGEGIVPDSVIGTSDVFSTTDVDPVIVSFTIPDTRLVTPNSATVSVQLSGNVSAISSATVRFTNTATGTDAGTVDFTSSLSAATAPGSAPAVATGLAPNTRYTIAFLEAYDQGGNPIPMIGSLDFLTRKTPPQVDTVATSLNATTGVIAASIRNGGAAPVDLDSAMTTVVYSLLDADDLSAGPVAQVSATSPSDGVEFNLLSIPGAGRGKSYVVRAEITWNDNYDTTTNTLDSARIDVPKGGPNAEFAFVSRSASSITLDVTVVDADDTIVSGLQLLGGTQPVPLGIGQQRVVVPTSGSAISLSAVADYRILASDPLVSGAVLQTKTLLAYGATSSTPSGALAYSGSRNLTLTPSAPSDLVGLTLDARYSLTKVGDASASWTGSSIGSLAYSTATIQFPQGSIAMGSSGPVTASVNVAATARFRQNGFDLETLVGQQIYLTNADGGQSVLSSAGRLVMQNASAPTAYQVVAGSRSASGDLTGLQLRNAVTGSVVGFGTYLNDSGSSAASLNMVRQPNGSFVMQVNGLYVSMTSTSSSLVSAIGSATGFMLYGVGEATSTSSAALTLPQLQVPAVDGTNFVAADTSVAVDVVGSDVDSVLLQDSSRRILLYANVYRVSDGAKVAGVQVLTLPSSGVRVTGLLGGIGYELRIEGSYNLGAGAGDESRVFFSQPFTTPKTAPSLTAGPTLTWSMVCGTNGRTTKAVVDYVDPSAVLTGIDYVLYDKTSAFDGVDLSNTAALEAAIASSGLQPAYTYNAGLSKTAYIPMFTGATQNYFAAKNYVVATYLRTSIPDSPRYIVAGRALTVTGPASATGTVVVKTVSQTGAIAGFTVADSQFYLTCADPMQFSYQLAESATPTAPVTQGTFSVARSASGPPDFNFTGLKPGTSYTLTISSVASDLRQGGARSWSVAKQFATANQYVTSNAVTLSINGTTATAAASNIQPGASDRITSVAFELYRIDNYGQSSQVNTLVESVPSAIPAAGGAATANFDLSAQPAGIYFARMVITYLATGSTYTYNADSIGRDYTPSALLRLAVSRSSVTVTNLESAGGLGDYVSVAAKDEAGRTVAAAVVASAEADKPVTLKIPEGTGDVSIEVTDGNTVTGRASGISLEDSTTDAGASASPQGPATRETR